MEPERLKAKLELVEATRLNAIPGTQIDLSLSGAAKQTEKKVKGDLLFSVEEGTATGIPVGSGDMTVEWVLDNSTKTATNQMTINSGAGTLRFACDATFTTSVPDNNITFTGTASLIAGTGAFRGLKACGLAFGYTDTLNGKNAAMTLTGTATYR